ncbi:MAG: M48 family metalloprotease [Pseudomonadota bacterium]
MSSILPDVAISLPRASIVYCQKKQIKKNLVFNAVVAATLLACLSGSSSAQENGLLPPKTLPLSSITGAPISSTSTSSSKTKQPQTVLNPLNTTVMGDSVEATLPWVEEVAMGEKVFYEFRQNGLWLDDPEIDTYLQSIVDKLRPRNGVWATRSIRAKAVNDNAINAFALPGGMIGVNIGLIRRVDSESELASVLAHEISHVTQRHVVRMMESQPNQLLWLLGGVLLAAISARAGNGDAAQGAIMAGSAGGAQQQLAFTQSFEREADAIGLERLENSKFDPSAMYTMLRSLQRQIHGNQLPPYLRTHPLESERMALIEGRLKEVPYKQYLSSYDFFLVRALASSYNDSAETAIERQKKLFETGQYQNAFSARYAWAAALVRADHYAEAEKVIEPLYSPKAHPMVLSLYGLALAKQKKYESALSVYQSALGLWPDNQQLAHDYAEALWASGRADKALKFLQETFRRMPNFTQAMKLASECAASLGKKSEQYRYDALYLGYHLAQWRPAVERMQWALDAATTWQERAELQSLQKKLKQRSKESKS